MVYFCDIWGNSWFWGQTWPYKSTQKYFHILKMIFLDSIMCFLTWLGVTKSEKTAKNHYFGHFSCTSLYNKRAVLCLTANFLNIVIRKNQKNKFLSRKRFFKCENCSFNWKQFWTNLKKSRKTAWFSLFTKIKGDYREVKTFQKV